jgi:hypothetical protein
MDIIPRRRYHNAFDDPMDVLRRELLTHPLRTTDASLACVFIPLEDALDVSNYRHTVPTRVSGTLWTLPGWNDGRDHLIFHYGDFEVGFEFGFAALAKSSFGPRWSMCVPLAQQIRSTNDQNSVHTPRANQMLRLDYDVVAPLSFYR